MKYPEILDIGFWMLYLYKVIHYCPLKMDKVKN